ncbi:MAG: YkgJ family cysteine cluster protein, partial [Candidatus Gastranaerophilales bacterium]|nr:YkgJ family cysteine cluster protein [Candidatus Gastranaerophilales bacterium]
FIKSVYYELISYLVPEKLKYKIEGSCNKCGKCCKEIHACGLKNEKDLKIMQFIFPWYRRFYISRKDNNEVILSCKYVDDSGLCSVYAIRPLLCRNYPAKSIKFNASLIDGCGFRIIKKKFKDYLQNH